MSEVDRPNLTIEDLLRLGQIGLEQGYWRDAERNFDLVLEQAPNHLAAMLGKARAIREPAMALHWAQHALLLWPDDLEAAALVAQLDQQALVARRDQITPQPLLPEPVLSPWQRPLSKAWAWALLATTLVIVFTLMILWRWPLTITPSGANISATAAPLAATKDQSPPAWAAPTRHPGITRAELATVLVLVPERDSAQVSRGSGILFDQQGLILTNQHVLTTESGRYLNTDKLALVGFARDARRAPEVWYIAAVMAADGVTDLAVLRLIATSDGQPLDSIPFEPIIWGNSNDLALGQDIIGLGFPSLGGDTLTWSKGSMAGFLMNAEGVELGKTEANLLPGGSGGPIVLTDGSLVGITSTAYTDERTQGRLSYFTLLSEADQVVAQGRRTAWSKPDTTWLSEQAQRTIQGQ